MTNQEYDNILMKAEEYEDQLDALNVGDRKSPDIPVSRSESPPSSRIAIIVGHSQRSPGARGVEPVSTYEYFWNSELAGMISSVASAAGVQCGLFYRDGIGISGAYQQVVEWAPDTCIELHFNAYNNQVTGTETLYGLYPPSRDWAQHVQAHIAGVFERAENGGDRGIKLRNLGERGGKSVNQLDTLPSCLIEPYFGDASPDARLARDKRELLARAIVEAHISMQA